ncbi:MAG: rhamnogalacturonan acetylesterase [Lachnospiraceae bacterium]|nr:rhamnogalacturonan acetylesterase [Lachnospiraceae bacterium]
MEPVKYEFGSKAIGAGTLYGFPGPDGAVKSPDYGFVTDENADLNDILRIPELNSGFLKNDSAGAARIIKLEDTPLGVKSVYEGDGLVPVLFKADVPEEGNYLVKVVISVQEDTDGMLFLGRRRLVLKRHFKKGSAFAGTYPVNVAPFIPRGKEEVFEDRSVDVALVGRGLVLKSIEIKKSGVPCIYIAGDSTLTDQSAVYPYDPAWSYSGWGQMLQYFVGNGMAVSNHAHSGLTTESMRSEGHYAILSDRIKKGDICLFQFGHNDQKLDSLKAFEGYTANLKRYIAEIKGKDAIPVIVSPLARNTWKGDGTYNDLLEEYARACEALAAEEKVPYIDLHAFSMDFVMKNGREIARRWYFPSDYTHTNDYGAYLFAGYVYSRMCALGLTGETDDLFSSELSADSDWMPPEEPPVIKLTIADKAGTEGNDAPESGQADTAAGSDLFADIDRPDDILTRAEAFEMVIKTVKFFPTNVYNDMFVDVVGHEVYAGSIECAIQNGIIPASMLNDAGKRIYPERPVTLTEFKEILRLGYLSRRPAGTVIESLDTCGIAPDGNITRKQAAYICGQVSI